MIWNLPNLLTLSRVVLIPAILALYVSGQVVFAAALFVFAALTDFFDGRVARALGATTEIGALLDPIADKFFALSIYGLIWYMELSPIWFIVIVLMRNFSQLMSVPILIWWLKRQFKVKPKWFAKWATAFSDLYAAFPLFLMVWFPGLQTASYVLMVIVAAMELWILLTYLPRLYAIATLRHDTFE